MPQRKKFWHCCSPTCSEIGYLVLECGLPKTRLVQVLLKLSTEPNTFTKTATLTKDKRKLSDAARCGPPQKRLCTTQKSASGDYVPGGH